MAEGDFQRVGDSDERMFGPQGVIAAGFNINEQSTLLEVLQNAGLDDVPVCFAQSQDDKEQLGALVSRIMTTGQGTTSALPRAVVLSGATEAQLNAVIGGYRAAGLPRPLWATLTETSITWSLSELLSELAEERAAIEGRAQ